MPSDIILIGPPMAGKSTLAMLLAEKLQVPCYSLDDLRWSYMKEFVRHPANYELAKHIVFTEGRTADACSDQIIELLE